MSTSARVPPDVRSGTHRMSCSRADHCLSQLALLNTADQHGGHRIDIAWYSVGQRKHTCTCHVLFCPSICCDHDFLAFEYPPHCICSGWHNGISFGSTCTCHVLFCPSICCDRAFLAFEYQPQCWHNGIFFGRNGMDKHMCDSTLCSISLHDPGV